MSILFPQEGMRTWLIHSLKNILLDIHCINYTHEIDNGCYGTQFCSST